MGSRGLSSNYKGKYKALLVCGVYKIVNSANGKFYIGSAKIVYDRWVRHLSELRYGKHDNDHLQRAWNSYGEECFKIEIVETCAVAVLLEREQYYLDLWRPYDINIGYNIAKKASGGDNYTDHPNKEEIRQKMISALDRFRCSLSVEEYDAVFRRFGERNSNYGNKWTDEQKKHLSDIKKGVPLPESTIKNIKKFYEEHGHEIWTEDKRETYSQRYSGEGNPFHGKKHSDQTKETLSRQAKERYSGIDKQELKKKAAPYKKEVIAGGIKFESLTDAAKHFDVSVTAIYNKIKAKKEGYYYVNDQIGVRKGKKGVIVESIRYDSLDQAVEKSTISRKTILKRIKDGKVGYEFTENQP